MAGDFNYHGDVIVFDLDDTLFRERDYVRSGFRQIDKFLRERLGHPLIDNLPQIMDSLLSARESYLDYLEKLAEENHVDSLLIKEAISIYRTHLPESLSLSENVEATLRYLLSTGVKMGIITDGRTSTQRAKFKSLGLDSFIAPDCLLISEETGKDKSQPDNFRFFVDKFPEARRFFYVADNERKDFITPNLLGWTTLKVPYNEDNVREDFINSDIFSRSACILSDFKELVTKFNPLGAL